MKTPPTVLTLQDLSSVGRCSLTVALPILSVLGNQAIPLPTALLSNHLGFKNYDIVDFSAHMKNFILQWKKNRLTIDAILTGFLSSSKQIDIVQESFHCFAEHNPLIVVDPAMADHGKLYSVYTADMVKAMKHLITQAQVITPNFTEASFLLGETYKENNISISKIHTWCQQLSQLGPQYVAITSVPSSQNQLITATYNRKDDQLQVFYQNKISLPVSGTGDIFSAVLTGSLLQNTSFIKAVEKSINFVYRCIELTKQAQVDPKYGVLFEPLLHTLYKED